MAPAIKIQTFKETCSALRVSEEDETGPYYLDDELFRSNITESEVGIPVTFVVTVVDTACSPVADAYVDIWHCNATGYYSGYLDSESSAGTSTDSSTSGRTGSPSGAPSGGSTMAGSPMSGGAAEPPAPDAGDAGSADGMSGGPTGTIGASMAASPSTSASGSTMSTSTTSNDNATFLRGIVATNSSGISVFQTIFPGWYSGRATHIHAKIHVPLVASSSEATEFNDSRIVHTGQVFFNDTLTNSIYYNIAPYTEKNASSSDHILTVNDQVFLGQAKSDLAQVAAVTEVVPGSITDGLNVYITFKVDPSSTPAAVDTGA